MQSKLNVSFYALMAILGLGFLPSMIWLVGLGSWAIRRKSATRFSGPVTVILAARNEEEHIGKALTSLSSCQFDDQPLEFLIVDDHSTDRTAKIIEKWSSQDARFRLIEAPDEPAAVGSKKRALAEAIRDSKGEILLFTDADCAVQEQWISSMVREFADERVGAVFGASLPIDKPGSLNHYFHRLERLMVNVTMAAAAGIGSPASACGHSIGYRKSTFEQIGGFAHPELPYGDDDLTIQAAARAGWKVRFVREPNSVVTDLREPRPAERRHAAARHQSTVSFYPVHWRIQYVLAIISAASFLLFPLAACFSRDFTQAALYFCLGKIALDAAAALTVTRPLGIRLSLAAAICGATLLPFLAMIRVSALLSPAFEWKSTSYKKSSRMVA